MMTLGHLADPHAPRPPLVVDTDSVAEARALHATMTLIRATEECIAALAASGEAGCPCHLAIGQEAPAAALATCLDAQDRVFGGHRSHAHYIACGGSIRALLAEVLGRADGAAGGYGGSMHLTAPGTAFAGSAPIVAGTVPLAVGAALAARMKGTDQIGVALLGDGACEEGVVHEAMNLAATRRLPVLFLVENNLYSSHMDIALRQPSDCTARFAEAHGIALRVVDGNDVLATRQAAADLIEHARQGQGPAFLEAVTYRWLGHVGPDPNVDVGLRRSGAEIAAWKALDPIARLEDALSRAGVSADQLLRAAKIARSRVALALDAARTSPEPDPAKLTRHVLSHPQEAIA